MATEKLKINYTSQN